LTGRDGPKASEKDRTGRDMGHGREGNDRAGQDRTGQDCRRGQDRTEQNRTEQDLTGRDEPQVRKGQDRHNSHDVTW